MSLEHIVKVMPLSNIFGSITYRKGWHNLDDWDKSFMLKLRKIYLNGGTLTERQEDWVREVYFLVINHNGEITRMEVERGTK